MSSLHFESEAKNKKTNIAIIIVALLTLICIGFGCSHMTKQTGSDDINNITQEAQSDQTPAF